MVILFGSLAGVEGSLYGAQPIEVYVTRTGDDAADGSREDPNFVGPASRRSEPDSFCDWPGKGIPP